MKTPLLILMCTAATPNVFAETVERKGWFWGGDLGAAYLNRTFDSDDAVDEASGRFYMDFFGGYAFNPHFAAGLELGGWLIEPDSDTYTWNPYWPPDNQGSEKTAGEGLSQVLVFTRLYPYRDKGLFIKLSGGYLEHWLKTDQGTITEQGWSIMTGVGWDILLSGSWSLTPGLSYSYGVAGSQTHQALTASIGFVWHQWKGPHRFSETHHD